MYYINAVELLNTCISNGLLRGKENEHVFVYRNAGNDPVEFPEGWYKEPIDYTARNLMEDSAGIRALEKALGSKGIHPKYTDVEQMKADCEIFLDFFKKMSDTGHAWSSDGNRIMLS